MAAGLSGRVYGGLVLFSAVLSGSGCWHSSSSGGRPLTTVAQIRQIDRNELEQQIPVRLTGRLIPASQLLRVTAVHSYIKGELHDVYYWCDVCNIRRSEKKICECCGGPMELRLAPVKK